MFVTYSLFEYRLFWKGLVFKFSTNKKKKDDGTENFLSIQDNLQDNWNTAYSFKMIFTFTENRNKKEEKSSILPGHFIINVYSLPAKSLKSNSGGESFSRIGLHSIAYYNVT